MPKELICEGKTSTEAIEKGLKELKVSKDKVDITILESEDKRSFFSILSPRVVKVKLVLKEEKAENRKKEDKRKNSVKYDIPQEDLEKAKKAVENFLNEFIETLKEKEIKSEVEIKDSNIFVTLTGENASEFIGYRGEVLNSLQMILSTIANKNQKIKIKLILDIANYKEKREKTLEDLAVKVSRTVLKTGKSITLEPMTAYERKIIHSKLQENNKITTYSVGEEPHRRIVIEKK